MRAEPVLLGRVLLYMWTHGESDSDLIHAMDA